MESLTSTPIADGSAWVEPTGVRDLSNLYDDADIYQILIADLIIQHSQMLKQVPLATAERAMQEAWKMSYNFEK